MAELPSHQKPISMGWAAINPTFGEALLSKSFDTIWESYFCQTFALLEGSASDCRQCYRENHRFDSAFLKRFGNVGGGSYLSNMLEAVV